MRTLFFILLLLSILTFVPSPLFAAQFTLDLGDVPGVTLVGAIERWDHDGNLKSPPDPKAKIDAPAVDAEARPRGPGRWVFENLPQGTYDLVILTKGRRRIEGFQFAPVREFDPFLPADKKPDEETVQTILDHIQSSPQYENVVEPLFWAGDDKAVRILMRLVRDKPTTYGDIRDAATIRHEIWQYSWKYGGWQKEKRTKVLNRIIMNRDELHAWTWSWDSKLGGIKIGEGPMELRYELPKPPQ